MDNKHKLLQKNYIIINKSNLNSRPKTTKEKIQDLIIQNEQSIKKYEKLKDNEINPRKKLEYVNIIAKYRTQQVRLHNKLYSLNSFINMCTNKPKNEIPKPKTRINHSANLYFHEIFNQKLNSTMKSSMNYSIIYTNSNNTTTKKSFNNRNYNKNNSSISSIIDSKKNLFPNEIKKISNLNIPKKVINKKKQKIIK